MKVFLVIAVVTLVHGSDATLLIKGLTEPVLRGEGMMLECRFSDSELNISHVHFEILSKRWGPLWGSCSVQIKQTAGTLVLSIPRVRIFHEGLYRCVSDAANVTAPNNCSQTLPIKVYYMEQLQVSWRGHATYRGFYQDLKLRRGDDVELTCLTSSSEEPTYTWTKKNDDWILTSSKLTLRNVNASDDGLYTCMAEHPSIPSLNKNFTIAITVLSSGALLSVYQSRLVLMISVALPLLMFILFMSAFLHRRATQTKTTKGPIDDRSQTKPIYKTSVESIPSDCTGKQPLV